MAMTSSFSNFVPSGKNLYPLCSLVTLDRCKPDNGRSRDSRGLTLMLFGVDTEPGSTYRVAEE